MKIKVKEIMNKRGLTAYALSKLTGISETNLGKMINGKTTSIKFENIDKLCFYLDVDIGDIIEVEIPEEIRPDHKNIP